jgi:hypothetical protein
MGSANIVFSSCIFNLPFYFPFFTSIFYETLAGNEIVPSTFRFDDWSSTISSTTTVNLTAFYEAIVSSYQDKYICSPLPEVLALILLLHSSKCWPPKSLAWAVQILFFLLASLIYLFTFLFFTSIFYETLAGNEIVPSTFRFDDWSSTISSTTTLNSTLFYEAIVSSYQDKYICSPLPDVLVPWLLFSCCSHLGGLTWAVQRLFFCIINLPSCIPFFTSIFY